jgi:hypothetical protein
MSAGTFFKTFNSSDRTTTRTLLHEAIPITGALVSGTYNRTSANAGREKNIKVYSHNMYQSVYDYPYLSSSANHIFDISVGVSPNSSLSASTVTGMSKKVNVYNQMAQVLNGYDTNGNIREFDSDGNFSSTGLKMREAIFLNFSRLLVKDEIKKGSFNLKMGLGNFTGSSKFQATITDYSGSNGYLVNSPAGEYGILYATASNKMMSSSLDTNNKQRPCGLIFYQAGVCVLTSSLFHTMSKAGAGGFLNADPASLVPGTTPTFDAAGRNLRDLIGHANETGSTITDICDGIRNKFIDLSFNNTTELNSTIYFCRANHNEFNYSSNPTYLTGSKIRVKGGDILTPPRSYVTTVGMYSADNELLAVAKLSEPLRKDPTNELTLRVRLDY